jgi:cytoskeletal protein CcmA (bactofilin family)
MANQTSGKQAAAQSRVPETPCVLGPTLKFKGVLAAEEDLIIQATVEGAIATPNNKLTIGVKGNIKANVQALQIIVEGTVEGDLHSEDAVIIRKSADINGNIYAPRISLEKGATFNGQLEMRGKAAEKAAPKQALEMVPVSADSKRR